MSKGGKKRDSVLKTSPSPVYSGVASFILSCGVAGAVTEARKGRYALWPEWNEADVNAEKWEGVKPVKDKEKSAKSPSQLFEDPEGKIELPPSLKIHSWKRPHEFLMEKIPVIVEKEKWFDLLAANEHLLESELMRWIINEIIMLWDTCLSPTLNDKILLNESGPPWKPWEHIYALCKAVRGHLPLYNSYGKYVIRLFWMGCWRKITLDDTMPFDKNDNLLLPATTCQEELWPMLLSKALIKIANIDMITTGRKELGDFTVLHALTGWRPEIIPLRSEEFEKIWSFLKTMVPEFILTNQEPPVPEEPAAEVSVLTDPMETGEKEKETKVESAAIKPAEKVVKDKLETKEAGKKKIKEGEHNKEKSKSLIQRPGTLSRNASLSVIELLPMPVMPQMVMYATYVPLQLSDRTTSLLGQMAESSEKLRHYGLSHMHSHPVLVRRTRSCPLVNPPEEIPIPQWKLIRPRNRPFPIADPKEPKPIKPEQYIEIASPLLDYKMDTTIFPPEKKEQQKVKKGAPPIMTAVTEIDETLELIQEFEETIKPVEPLTNKEISQADESKTGELSSIPSLVQRHLKKNVESKKETQPDSIKSAGQLSAKPPSAKSRHGSPASRHGSGKAHQGSAAENKKEEPIKSPAKTRQSATTDPNKEDATNARQQQGLTEENTSILHINTELSRASSQILNADATSDVTFSFTLDQKFCKEKWIDHEDFCKCFHSLIIFHNSSKYIYSVDKSTFKFTDDRGPFYLLVDDLKPIEILVTFSALVRWGDLSCEKSLSKESNEKDHQKEASGLMPGVLLAERYCWKSFVSNPPILYMKTLATKSTILELPSGRHVLRFTATAPLGYNINISGNVPFIFGDEDLILSNLGKESLQFSQQAATIVKAVQTLMRSFIHDEALKKPLMELQFSHFPIQFKNKRMAEKQIQAFNNALYATLPHILNGPVSPKINFAFRVLLLDVSPKEVLGKSKLYPVPEQWQNRTPSHEEILAAIKLQACWRKIRVQDICNATRVGTAENLYCQVILDEVFHLLDVNREQNGLFLLRYLFNKNPKQAEMYPYYNDEQTRTVYADYTVSYSDQPPRFWFLIFREIFFVSEDMLVVPKVYTLLSTYVLHVVNNDTGEEIPRVFQKVAPHVYTKNKTGYTFVAEAQSGAFTLSSGKWKMRLIGSCHPLPILSSEPVNNNFTMKEIKSYYIPNDKNLIFRFQINVNLMHLSTIHVQTSKPDVYIKIQILDQDKEVAKATGKGQAVISSFMFYQSLGRSFIHKSSVKQPETLAVQGGSKKSASSSSRIGRGSLRSGSDRKVSPLKDESSSILIPFTEDIPEAAEVTHKYKIQALVLHNSWPLNEAELTFAESQRDLDNSEVTEKTTGPSLEADESKHTPTARHTRKGKDKSDKSDKIDKSDKGKEKTSQHKTDIPAWQIDSTKPHFTLHYVVDYDESDSVEIKKDTSQQDEIQAMKRAWEAAEPGRAFKALQLRLRVLNNKETNITLQGIGEKQDEIVNGNASEINTQATEPEIPSTAMLQDGEEIQYPAVDGKVIISDDIIKPMEWTKYIRSTLPEPVLENGKIIEEREKVKAEVIYNFRQKREIVFQQREKERQSRRQLKAQQLQMFEDLQAALDEARQGVFQLRETYRTKLIEKEMKKQREIAQMEALQAEQERKSKSGSSKKSKSPGKKK
ncbi:androglobin isoform X2 [Leucoraja erinacea]|uniref:androglobin isoform X2 n=1 Tax=Leucoraja erinaceus TaxID=7782 RepID=UPI002453E61A|nr:androglobin isoform X2 [Leucoraja erinacea]